MGTALDIKIKRANKVYRCGVSADASRLLPCFYDFFIYFFPDFLFFSRFF